MALDNGDIVEIPRGATIREGACPDSDEFIQLATQWGRVTGLFKGNGETVASVVVSLKTRGGLPINEIIFASTTTLH